MGLRLPARCRPRALWTVLWRPGDKTVGAIQHFAAGVIFYAAAGELLPDTVRHRLVIPVVLGGAAGIGCMLLLRHFTERTKGSAGLIGASAIDALIDGVVLGLGFGAGAHPGELLAIAIAVEFLFLGLAIATALAGRASRSSVVGLTAGVALAVPLGALLSIPILSCSEPFKTAAFAFGLIAVLYLVTEELLVEAHEKPETAWGAALFFVGFLALTILDEMMGSA